MSRELLHTRQELEQAQQELHAAAAASQGGERQACAEIRAQLAARGAVAAAAAKATVRVVEDIEDDARTHREERLMLQKQVASYEEARAMEANRNQEFAAALQAD